MKQEEKQKKTNLFKLLWYSHPRMAIALVLLAINLLVILLFTGILAIVSGNGFFDELAYIFTYTMCSDGIYDFVNSQEDVACFVIKIVLTVVQMVIFSGALIGFTTDLLQSTIDNRLENVSKLKLNDHYVFLNWSSIGPNIVYDLSFLEGKKTVVILSDKNREEVLNSIYNIFTENERKLKNLRIYVKHGDPASVKHLSDISISRAKYIGILLSDTSQELAHGMSINDLAAFKTLITIVKNNQKANIVVETEEDGAAKKMEEFVSMFEHSTGRVSVFSHNSFVGHILGQMVVNPTYSYLFHDLLSYHGCEFYALPPMDVEEALYKYSDCIPIANYDDDCCVDAEGKRSADSLYVLSDDAFSLGERTKPASFVKEIPYREREEGREFTVIIVSDSNRVEYAIEEFKAYNAERGTNIQYKIFSFEENIDKMIAYIKSVKGEKKILLLSSEKDSESVQDSYVFISLLSLKLNREIDANVPIYVEIINPKNLTALKELGVASVIVSNKIISLYMVQLLTHRGSRRFFKDIIMANTEGNHGDVDFKITQAKHLLELSETGLSFTCYAELVQSLFLASGKMKMCIGVRRAGDAEGVIEYFCDKMDESRSLNVYPDDELIYVQYSQAK